MAKEPMVRIGRIELLQGTPPKSKILFNKIEIVFDPSIEKNIQVWDWDNCLLMYYKNIDKYKAYLSKKYKATVLFEYKYTTK